MNAQRNKAKERAIRYIKKVKTFTKNAFAYEMKLGGDLTPDELLAELTDYEIIGLEPSFVYEYIGNPNQIKYDNPMLISIFEYAKRVKIFTLSSAILHIAADKDSELKEAAELLAKAEVLSQKPALIYNCIDNRDEDEETAEEEEEDESSLSPRELLAKRRAEILERMRQEMEGCDEDEYFKDDDEDSKDSKDSNNESSDFESGTIIGYIQEQSNSEEEDCTEQIEDFEWMPLRWFALRACIQYKNISVPFLKKALGTDTAQTKKLIDWLSEKHYISVLDSKHYTVYKLNIDQKEFELICSKQNYAHELSFKNPNGHIDAIKRILQMINICKLFKSFPIDVDDDLQRPTIKPCMKYPNQQSYIIKIKRDSKGSISFYDEGYTLGYLEKNTNVCRTVIRNRIRRILKSYESAELVNSVLRIRFDYSKNALEAFMQMLELIGKLIAIADENGSALLRNELDGKCEEIMRECFNEAPDADRAKMIRHLKNKIATTPSEDVEIKFLLKYIAQGIEMTSAAYYNRMKKLYIKKQ